MRFYVSFESWEGGRVPDSRSNVTIIIIITIIITIIIIIITIIITISTLWFQIGRWVRGPLSDVAKELRCNLKLSVDMPLANRKDLTKAEVRTQRSLAEQMIHS